MFARLLAGLLFAASAGVAAAQPAERVVVLGFDGADPDAIAEMIAGGDLPHLARLAREGTFAHPGHHEAVRVSRLPGRLSQPGMNPGRTRIFDFLEKREDSYVPQIALVRQASIELPGTPFRVGLVLLLALGAGITAAWLLQRVRASARVRWTALVVLTAVPGVVAALVAAWVPAAVPQAVRAREGDAFWKIAGGAGVPTVALQAPMEFPVEESPGARILAGFGVPDIRKSFGLWSVYTTDLLEEESTETGGTRFPLRFDDGVAAERDPRAAQFHRGGRRDGPAGGRDPGDLPEERGPAGDRDRGRRLEPLPPASGPTSFPCVFR